MFYKDGVLDNTVSNVVGPIQAGVSTLRLGARTYSGAEDYLNGKLDDTRLYNRTLSSAEVTQIYNNPGTIASAATGISRPGCLPWGLGRI